MKTTRLCRAIVRNVQSGRAFTNLFDSRQRGDYDEFVYSTREEVDELYPKAQRFIEEVDALLND